MDCISEQSLDLLRQSMRRLLLDAQFLHGCALRRGLPPHPGIFAMQQKAQQALDELEAVEKSRSKHAQGIEPSLDEEG